MNFRSMAIPGRRPIWLPMLLMICAADASAAPALQLELSVDKTQFALGEPVVVQATLRNTGTEMLEVTSAFDPTNGSVRYSVTPSGGTAMDFEPVWLDEHQRPPTTKLAPGEQVTGDARLFVNASGVTFAAPGSYTVNARYGKLQAAPLNLSISGAASSAEREAAALMTHKDVAMFLFAGGGETLVQAKPNLQKVIATAPNSLLAGYASYALAAYYAVDARDFQRNALRRADPAKAEALMIDALRQPLSAPFRIKAYSRVISTATSNKHPEVAQKYLEEFRHTFGSDPRAASVLKSLETTSPARR